VSGRYRVNLQGLLRCRHDVVRGRLTIRWLALLAGAANQADAPQQSNWASANLTRGRSECRAPHFWLLEPLLCASCGDQVGRPSHLQACGRGPRRHRLWPCRETGQRVGWPETRLAFNRDLQPAGAHRVPHHVAHQCQQPCSGARLLLSPTPQWSASAGERDRSARTDNASSPFASEEKQRPRHFLQMPAGATAVIAEDIPGLGLCRATLRRLRGPACHYGLGSQGTAFSSHLRNFMPSALALCEHS
jgi:hypothetical protein